MPLSTSTTQSAYTSYFSPPNILANFLSVASFLVIEILNFHGDLLGVGTQERVSRIIRTVRQRLESYVEGDFVLLFIEEAIHAHFSELLGGWVELQRQGITGLVVVLELKLNTLSFIPTQVSLACFQCCRQVFRRGRNIVLDQRSCTLHVLFHFADLFLDDPLLSAAHLLLWRRLAYRRLHDLAVRSVFAELVLLILQVAFHADLGMRRPGVLTERSLVLRDGLLDGRNLLLKQFPLVRGGVLCESDAAGQGETSNRAESLS